MNTPAVSICCITYNHEKYIRDALEGFLMQQTNFPFEILIHDDASTDHTADIIREYEAKYPDIIKPTYQTVNQYSQGKSIWCEFQFPYAKGKYIALCEGDDFWTDPRKLQIQYDFMETHPDYSMCFGEAIVSTGKEEDTRSLFAKLENKEYSAKDFYESWLIATCTAFIRKEVVHLPLYEKINQDQRFVYGDLPLWLTAASCGKVFGFGIPLGQYNLHPGGVTQRKNDFAWRKRLVEYNKALHEYFPETNQWKDSFGCGNAYALGKQYLCRGNLWQAIKMFHYARLLDSNFLCRWIKKDLERMR